MVGSGVKLPGAERVTICAIDCANPVHALLALDISLSRMAFADAVFLSDRASEYALDGVRMVNIPRIESGQGYSRFVLKELGQHFDTSHVLLIRWDGYVLDPSAWRAEFLDFDYIGAPWGWYSDEHRVGNGGFSLRSGRLCTALRDPEVAEAHPEDEAIGRRYRPLLESRHGIRFAPESLAAGFSFEATYPTGPTFGFHGLFNMWMVVPRDGLGRFVAELSDEVVAGPQYLRLARNYRELNRREEAIITLQERARRNSSDTEAMALLSAWQSDAQPAALPGVGRNDPCPCGSGKRYKACCGQLGQPGPNAGTDTIRASFDPRALLDQATAFHQAGNLEQAETIYRRVLAVAPDNIVAMQYLGVLSLQKGDALTAETMVRRAIASADDVPEFHSNLGLCLRAQGRLEEAVACYRRAISLRSDYAGAYSNLGLDLQALGRPEHAMAAFEDAIAADPALAEAHWNLGLVRLLLGRYRQAWAEYEWRLRCQAFERDRLVLPGATPWQGEPLAGRTLLIRQEQGAGDTIQFMRFIPPLVGAAGRVIVEIAPSLQALARASLPGAVVVDRDGWQEPADFYVNLMSLPLQRALALEQLPFATRYVKAEPESASRWRDRVAGSRGLRVGIAWAGNPTHANDRNRSCPAEFLEPLLGVGGCSWFSLQKGRPFPSAWRGRVVDLAEELQDFAETAAAMQALDLVVAVDTSVAHLAGALGVPVWVMLPFAPDWRWLVDRADSPWYPSARLFRQSAPGDWHSVAESVVSALTRLSQQPPPTRIGPD